MHGPTGQPATLAPWHLRVHAFVNPLRSPRPTPGSGPRASDSNERPASLRRTPRTLANEGVVLSV